MASDIRRAYLAHRAKGTPASVALQVARHDVGAATPRYEFLSRLNEYAGQTSGSVGPFSVHVRVEYDGDARLGEDDVTGTFVEVYEDGCVPNRARGNNGSGMKYYRPSNDTMQHAAENFRRAGMSRGNIPHAVRERIAQEMYEDANREYFGVTVAVYFDGVVLAEDGLWGIDTVPGYDGRAYLISTATEMIDEGITRARAEIPAMIDRLNKTIEKLRAAAQEAS